MIYLATPYWHENPEVRLNRVKLAISLTRAFIRRRVAIFSPIAHAHAMNDGLEPLPLANSEWVDLDLSYIAKCSYILVAQIDGWQQSKGIAREVLFAQETGIPVAYINPTSCQEIINREILIGQSKNQGL